MSVSRNFEVSSSVRQNLKLAALERGIVENLPAAVKQCIDDGVNVNAITPFSGVRPLDLALEMSNVSVMRLLLEGGADTEGKTTQGSTTLINASRYGYLECVKLLVEHGANIYAGDSDGKTCLHVALEKGHYSVVSYLLRHDAHKERVWPRDGLCLLQHLILTDDAASVSNLKHTELDLNVPCPDGTVVVFFATRYWKNKALKALLKVGANPNICTVDFRFALHEAIRWENKDAVKTLMEHGASTRQIGQGNGNPFDIVITRFCLPMLRLLLDCGANIEQNCNCGSTPLIAACSVGFLKGVQLLVERGANLRALSEDGQTCLIVTLKCGHQSVVDYLLDQDICEVNEKGRDGVGALHHAVLLNNIDLMSKLILKQANVNTQNLDGEVPLYLAVKYGRLNLLDTLLKAGANPNISTKDGDFALHEAVNKGSIGAVRLLLEHGADRNRLDENDMTPVKVAETLVPPPKDIIDCLIAEYLDKEEAVGFSHVENFVQDSVGHAVGDSKNTFDDVTK